MLFTAFKYEIYKIFQRLLSVIKYTAYNTTTFVEKWQEHLLQMYEETLFTKSPTRQSQKLCVLQIIERKILWIPLRLFCGPQLDIVIKQKRRKKLRMEQNKLIKQWKKTIHSEYYVSARMYVENRQFPCMRRLNILAEKYGSCST